MITLGLNAAFHGRSAALVVDGRVVAAVEQRHVAGPASGDASPPDADGDLPLEAIDACLAEAGVRLVDLDHVACAFDPSLLPHDGPADPMVVAMLDAPARLAAAEARTGRERLAVGGPARSWRWHYLARPLCQQAGAFLAAPFDRCAVLTLDGRGERSSTCYGVYADGRYRTLGEVPLPHSLDLLQQLVAVHLGWPAGASTSALMALAATGEPRWADALAAHVHLTGAGHFNITPPDLTALAGAPLAPGSPLRPVHRDLAASLQQVLERKVLKLLEWLREASGQTALVLSGPVVQNAVLNARLRDEGPFEALWVQPAAGDAGAALGAALWLDARERRPRADDDKPPRSWPLAPRRWHMTHAELGTGWLDEDIEVQLRRAGLPFETLADAETLAERVAALLVQGRLVGWFQGRMAWGPNPLGTRSVLASPLLPLTPQRLGEWQGDPPPTRLPLAVTAEAFGSWFAPGDAREGQAAFMTSTHQLLPTRAGALPGAGEADGDVLVQAVTAGNSPRLHLLLRAFGRHGGVPLLVSAPLATARRPLACSPRAAIEMFAATSLEALAIGHCLLCKPGIG